MNINFDFFFDLTKAHGYVVCRWHRHYYRIQRVQHKIQELEVIVFDCFEMKNRMLKFNFFVLFFLDEIGLRPNLLAAVRNRHETVHYQHYNYYYQY